MLRLQITITSDRKFISFLITIYYRSGDRYISYACNIDEKDSIIAHNSVKYFFEFNQSNLQLYIYI